MVITRPKLALRGFDDGENAAALERLRQLVRTDVRWKGDRDDVRGRHRAFADDRESEMAEPAPQPCACGGGLLEARGPVHAFNRGAQRGFVCAALPRALCTRCSVTQ